MEIRELMQTLSRKDRFPFHMPGHKNLFPEIMDRYDPTELPGLDNLHSPSDLLKRAQQRVADIYQVKHTYFLVNGSSVGLMAAMLALLRPGDKVLVERTCHKAIIAGLIHSGATPVFIPQHYSLHLDEWLPPQVQDVKDCLEREDIKGAVFTNPGYLGLAPKLGELIKICKSKGIRAIIDEAHGAHLNWGRELGLPGSAVDLDCDIIVQSPHKTLPALTQGAWLHLKSSEFTDSINRCLNIFQTTSPSYLILASLEFAAAFSNSHGPKALKRSHGLVKLVRKRCDELGLEYWRESPGDWSKFVLKKRVGMVEQLNKRGIYPELERDKDILLMFTMADGLKPKGASALYSALDELSKLALLPKVPVLLPPDIPLQAMSPREAWLARGKWVNVEDAKGLIVRQVIAPYPPGTTVAAPGQVLDREHIEYLKLLAARKVIPGWIDVLA